MSDNTKDWANIRIEEPVRDEARDDPRTYTQIMQAGLQATSHADGSVSVNGDAAPQTESQRMLKDVSDQLDRIESSASTAEERTGSIENTLESAGLGR